MTQIILIIIGIVVLVLVLTRGTWEKIVGICAVAFGQDARKRENKEKILALFAEKNEFSNADIREALGISERSVVRYLDELEKEGKVEQIVPTGRGVFYPLK